ncbi:MULTISPECIES: type II secretion system protein [Clostridia]|uniref:type II secretion system protein n=1 Tax=Clostridia TaxID=186801 RepID=UPI000E51D8FF|nr:MULTISPECIES: type II secretion system protein [Clostridia]RHV71128.1 type II secretion system protein [Roseburia sp. OM02-15]
MRKTGKKGFTLTELIVVLVIMGIIAAIAVPLFTNYWRNAEFRKNEENARTVYLAAESKLTYYRSSGQWDSFQKQIKKQAEKDQEKSDENRTVEEAVFPPDQENAVQLNGRIYTLRLYKNASDADQKNNLLLQLIDDYIYDKDMLNASIAVEIDIESGEVYSAFYGSRCKGLTYESEDKDDYLTMQKRDYDSRKKRLLGYYSTEDTVNVVSLKPTKLRITTISLQNSEKLTLNWSSNAGESLDVSYKIAMYKKDGTPLFSMVLSPFDVRTEGWSGKDESSTYAFASVTLLDGSGKDQGKWSFPLTYSDNKYSLVLDAMMSAKTQALLTSRTGTDSENALLRTLSTSICRLAGMTEDQALATPQDIYATVEAMSYAGTDSHVVVSKEYSASDAATSNTANSMYADKTDGNDVRIAVFRHLSNMRYYDDTKEAAFTLTDKNMDWASVGTGVYDLTEEQSGSNTLQKLAWKENSTSKTVDFPTIANLPKKQTLTGKGKRTLVSHLKLGEASIVDDETINNLTQAASESRTRASVQLNPTEYLGLFGEIEGTIDNVTLQDAHLSFGVSSKDGDSNTADSRGTYASLKGIGILAGRNAGSIKDTSLTSTEDSSSDQAEKNVEVSLSSTAVSANRTQQAAAVGGVVGILADTDESGNLTTLTSGKLENVTMEGAVKVQLPNVSVTADISSENDTLKNYALGIGGIVGYANIESAGGEKSVIISCENHAGVSGNYMTGGIAGKIDGTATKFDQTTWKNDAAIKDSSNTGLILCTEDTPATVVGNYFGGIAGYAYQTLIYNSTSASGRTSGFTYNKDKKDLLKGQYVGGIVGYGNHSLMANCGTESNGYILGSKYVGGIAGGLGGNINEAIQAHQQESVSVTTNRSYVVGNECVGGIVGHNTAGVMLSNCINNGVVAGTQKDNGDGGRYVGGIVGYNANGATIHNCASYLSDYGSSIFNMIVNDWDAKSDYVGGIAGYNNGFIEFTKDSEAITVKSVSSIVVGNNYVGGIAGFNDVQATLDVNYTLIGGQIYAYETCAGGAFGFNASENAARQSLTVKPRSVQGKYFVGGVMGANVLAIDKNTTISGLRAENTLGTITGEAFTGGVIGYQRTYDADQLNYKLDTNEDGIRAAVEAAQNSTSSSDRLLPGMNENNIPTAVMTSKNSYTLTISTEGNTDDSLTVNTNNIQIQTVMYSGGVLGYCDKGSKIEIKNCKNTGSITFASDLLEKDSTGGIKLGKYAASGEIPELLTKDASELEMHFIGGITGVNLQNETITHCANTGSLSGFTGIGGVVGLNAGTVKNCELSEHFGNVALEYVGGIVGINSNGGTISKCTTDAGKTISGNNHLGGITGWNLKGGTLTGNENYATVNASGKDNSDYAAVGGIAGQNSGTIVLQKDSSTKSRSVSGAKGAGVGGLVGINESDGQIQVTGTGGTSGEIIVVSNKVTVQGYEQVGGIVGINHGKFSHSGSPAYITAQAKKVQASHGTAGGVVGVTDGDIHYAVNRCESVSADAGNAGGIVAENTNKTAIIKNCNNYGNVRSSDGYAGGIVATNAGMIQYCRVQSPGSSNSVEIYSLGVNASGAIAATNSGTITDCLPGATVILRGNATVYGGIVGENTGKVTSAALNAAGTSAYNLSYMPQIKSDKNGLTVGGAVGSNTGVVSGIVASNLCFENFSGYKYLGGIVGTNGVTVNQNPQNAGAQISVTNCKFTGIMTEKVNAGAAGNCYGGIAGINYDELKNNTVDQITMNIQGVYTATSTSTTAQKEAMASHAGGIVGKNEINALIDGCTLTDNSRSVLQAKFGMLGGVTGFNKGTIQMSGSSITASIMTTDSIKDSVTLTDAAVDKNKGNLSADSNPVNWSYNNGFLLENATYQNTNTKISANRLNLKMTDNGNVGGITAFNSTEGLVNRCVSGNWFLLNRSEAIGVGTGGIIGMNESENDLTCLVNGAFVGRQVSAKNINGKDYEQGQTDRFAGGIIGNQNTSTGNEWTIENCINFGTVYCYRTHYSGGIIGQWTASGGTIKDCRNFGSLQTTYQCDWKGASGGIVAQLYHAYEDNEYNIISCENHGNIYMRDGASLSGDSHGANDSAGILGNVTTYKVDNADRAQNFTIRILDCVNGPGVKLYSASMGAGIFGYLSCDNASVGAIQKSTCKVKIDVERCRNFANVLRGRSFCGGIFGARYSVTGWSNTIVKDCYSADLATGSAEKDKHYTPEGSPIYSTGNNHEGSVANIANAEDRKNNFFINGREARKYGSDYGYYFNKFVLGRLNADGSVQSYGTGETNVGVTRRTNATWNNYISNIHAVAVEKTASGYRYAYAEIYSGCNTIGSDCFVDANGYIVKVKADKTTRIGQILFYTWDEDHKDHDNLYYKCTEKGLLDPDGKNNAIYYNSRESYRRLEGIITVNDKNQLQAPVYAKAKVADGMIDIAVTPGTLPTDNSQLCDPFAYVVKIVGSDGTTVEKTIYSETGSFEIPKGISGNIKVSVRAKSMFSDVLDSTEYNADVVQSGAVLPSPDVRAELTVQNKISGWRTDYRYSFSLNNLEAYSEYDDWKVTIYINAYGKDINVVLDADHPTAVMTDLDLGDRGQQKRNDRNNTYQIISQATATTGKYESSPVISTAAYMPYYQAFISLNPANSPGTDTVTNRATTSYTISGDTLDTLNVNVSIDNSNASEILEVAPIYRAELIGNWGSKKDVVFAKTDIMTVSKGVATAQFSNLPEYLKDATNLHVRLWYAQTGLGPVYLYHEADNASDANVSELLNVDENGNETWGYCYSWPIRNEWKDFNAYRDESSQLFSWLPAPKMDQTDGSTLTPTYDSDNRMQYTFSWDKNVSTTDDPKYEVSMTGIDANGREVTIDTSSSYTGGRSMTIDGEDWNYTQVRLKVTRIGDASQKKIGLSTTATYYVAQRLEKPGQPSVTNIDDNELNYNVVWSGISDESYCQGYQIYVREYSATGSLGTAEKAGTLEKATGAATYSQIVNLEKYAGKRIVVYLVAESSNSAVFIDSAVGVTSEIQVPARIASPKVTWNVNWTYDTNQPMESADFLSGGLRVGLRADSSSIPPGGSAYLLRAYVYNSLSDANQATASDPGNYTTVYPTGNVPVQMDVSNAQNYYHLFDNLSIKYAGKWVVFYARISSGAGSVSSLWTRSTVAYQLPYVKLAQPGVTSDTKSYSLEATVQTTPNVPGSVQIWNARHTVLEWNSVDCADMYSINLTGQVTDLTAANGMKALQPQIRVLETTDASGTKKASVQQYVWKIIKEATGTQPAQWGYAWESIAENPTSYPANTPETDKVHTWDISTYSVPISSSYTAESGNPNYYTLTLTAQVEAQLQADGSMHYTLKLPDVEQMTAADGSTVTHTDFTITNMAVFIANVQKNLEATPSSAYAASDPCEIKWNN